ncbi:MAG: hypothetical protein WBQ38_15815 [Ignavibacteria bacterium]
MFKKIIKIKNILLLLVILMFCDNAFSQISGKIKSGLPSGAFLREYEKLLDVDDEIYIGLYITDFSDPVVPVTPENQSDLRNLFYTCPESTLGQSMTGNYFAFIFKNNKVISTFKIPAIDEEYSLYNSVCLYNTPANNCFYFNFDDGKSCKNLSTSTLEKTDLIQLLDLTGDSKRNEFILTGVQDACGYVNRLVVAYDEESKNVMIYPVVRNNMKYFWNYRFLPLNGECTVTYLCGDHGNHTYTREDYKFDDLRKQYDLIHNEKKECTEGDY